MTNPKTSEAVESAGAHTGEPWEVHVWERHVFVGGSPNNDDIAEFNFENEATVKISKAEAIANAKLFAAAPALLASCIWINAQWTTDFPEGPDGHSILHDSTREVWKQVRAAIAKATGGAA